MNWKIIAGVILVVWLALMVALSHYGYKQRDPVRIENWQPAPD